MKSITTLLLLLITISVYPQVQQWLINPVQTPMDTIPDAFTFTDVSNAVLSSYHTSNGVTLTGFTSCWCSAAGDSFKVNGGALRTAAIQVFNGDVVYLTKVASGSYSTAVSSTLTAGSTSDIYTVATGNQPGTIISADLYVDGTNGSNSNNGLTPAAAKQTIAGILAAGSLAGKVIAFRDSLIYRNSSTTETWRLTDNGVKVTNWYGTSSSRYPKFTGGAQITNWTNYSGNVWVSTTNVAAASAVWLNYGDSTVWGEQMSSLGSIVKEGQYFITGSTMYIYAPSDPDAYYQSIDRDDRASIFYINSGTDDTLQYIEVYGSTNFNIFINAGADRTIIDQCRSHHAGTYANLLAGGGSHCIQIRANDVKVMNSDFYEGTNHGIHIYPFTVDASGIILEHNSVYNNHHTGIDQNSNGPNITGTIIRYNHVYETKWARERQFAGYDASASRQIGIWEQGSMAVSPVIEYNLLDNNVRGSMALNGSNNLVYNNTCVMTVPQTSAYSGYNLSGNGEARNNIVVQNSNSYNCISFNTTSNNITYNYGSGGTSGGTNSNPQFVDYNGLDFHLQAGSPAINFGTDVGLNEDYDGIPITGNPDAGAYEYH